MKIVVLAGGISTERDVSLSSGSLIYRCLKERGHQVILLDVFLGYEKEDVGDVFEKELDWAAEIGHVSEDINLSGGGCCIYGTPWRKRGKRQDTGMF